MRRACSPRPSIARCCGGIVSSRPSAKRARRRRTEPGVRTRGPRISATAMRIGLPGKASDPISSARPRIDDFSGWLRDGTELALERVIVRTSFKGADVAEQLANLTELETRFESKWATAARWRSSSGEALSKWAMSRPGCVVTNAPSPHRMGRPRSGSGAARECSGSPGVGDCRHGAEGSRQMKAREARGLRPRRELRRDARMWTPERSLRRQPNRVDTLIDESLALLTKLVAVEETMERARPIWILCRSRGPGRRRSRKAEAHQRDLRQMSVSYRNRGNRGWRAGRSDLFYLL